jgi:hypothetical protein
MSICSKSERFHFDVRCGKAVFSDEDGRPCASLLEAIAVARDALHIMMSEAPETQPWIEVSDGNGRLVATVHWDETLH